MCEQLNFIVVLSMWFITNKFLKYQFLTYGPLVFIYFNLPVEERQDAMRNPMCEAFPRIASCNYYRFVGRSTLQIRGNLQGGPPGFYTGNCSTCM